MDSIPSVVIVGGGIAGLATAFYLQEEARARGLPLRYTLLEGSSRVGGKIVTDHHEGFVIEGGPDSFLSQKPWAAELARQVGLATQLMGTNDAQRRVSVLHRGKLLPLPEGVMLIVPTRVMPFLTSPLFSWPGKLRMGLDFFIPPRRSHTDESVADFVRRRLGQEALERLAEPMLSGIHMSEAEQQSLLATFPRFHALEQTHGSLIRGMLAQRRAAPPTTGSAFLTLRGGMGALVQGVQQALQGEIVTTCLVRAIAARSEGGYEVRTDQATYSADAVVMATPAAATATMLAPCAPALSAGLAQIRYVSTATISLGFRAAEMPYPLDGFGFVIPRREQRHLAACTWSSTKFVGRAPEGKVLLRCFVGGPEREALLALDDEALIAVVREELGQIMGLRAEPVMARVFRWQQANPQYDVGHLARVRTLFDLAQAQPGLFLTGSSYEGVGVPDCVRQGREAAGRVLDYLPQAQAAERDMVGHVNRG